MADSERSPIGQVPAVERTLDAESRARLEHFCHRFGEQLDCIAGDFACQIYADPASRRALDVVSTDADDLRRLVRCWLDVVLRGPSAPIEPHLDGVYGLRKLAEVPQACLLGCIAQARSRVIELANRSSEDWTADHLVANAVALLMDAQLCEMLRVHRLALLEQLELSRRLATMGHLVASIGHELRNPLQAIDSSAYLLSQRLVGHFSNDHALEKHVNKIRHQVTVATNTTSALLDLARGRAPCKTRFALLPLIEEARASVAFPAGVRVELDAPRELVAYGDREQIRILVQNLLANAVHAVGITGTVSIDAQPSGDGTTVQVSDDGSGIAPSERQHLFEFMHTTKPDGCGIGLPLCRRIAIAHSGTLNVEPSERGARFRLWLPDQGDNGVPPS